MPNYVYSDEFKLEVVRYYKSGHTVAETREKYGIAESTLFVWKEMYESRKFSKTRYPPKDKIPIHQKTHLNKLERISEAIRVLPCGKMASIGEKVETIKKYKDQYSIHVLCEVLQISRGTYYYRVNHEKIPTQYELSDDEFKPLIKQIFFDSGERFGSKPIRAKLVEKGFIIKKERVARLMREMGLHVKLPEYIQQHLRALPNQRYANLLKREFNPPAPDTVWVSDITYVKVDDHYAYVCVIIDLYARKVLAYGVSKNIDVVLVLETFDSAYEIRHNPQGLMFHSDQGVQYTAFVFRERLKSLEITQSFSTPGMPYDNAVCESFFRTMKKEAIYHHLYKNEKELSLVVDEYIHFYNDERPRRALNMKTPTQYESEFYLAFK